MRFRTKMSFQLQFSLPSGAHRPRESVAHNFISSFPHHSLLLTFHCRCSGRHSLSHVSLSVVGQGYLHILTNIVQSSLSLSHPGNLLEAATGGKSHRRHQNPLRLSRRGNNVWMLCDNTAHKENLMSSTVCHEEWCVDSARGAKFDKLE